MHDSEKPADNRHPGLSTVQEGSSPRRQKPPAARSQIEMLCGREVSWFVLSVTGWVPYSAAGGWVGVEGRSFGC